MHVRGKVRGTFHRRVVLTLVQWQLALPQRSDQLIQLSVGIAPFANVPPLCSIQDSAVVRRGFCGPKLGHNTAIYWALGTM